jgi:hypothetical protein
MRKPLLSLLCDVDVLGKVGEPVARGSGRFFDNIDVVLEFPPKFGGVGGTSDSQCVWVDGMQMKILNDCVVIEIDDIRGVLRVIAENVHSWSRNDNAACVGRECRSRQTGVVKAIGELFKLGEGTVRSNKASPVCGGDGDNRFALDFRKSEIDTVNVFHMNLMQVFIVGGALFNG